MKECTKSLLAAKEIKKEMCKKNDTYNKADLDGPNYLWSGYLEFHMSMVDWEQILVLFSLV